MKFLIKTTQTASVALLLASFLLFPLVASADHIEGNPPGVQECVATSNFLGFPNWYRNLECEDGGHGGVMFTNIEALWVIVANVLDIAIRVAGLLAVVMIVYGGIRYITSQGQPESLQTAKNTIMYAVIGLVIAILATTIVGFIAGQF